MENLQNAIVALLHHYGYLGLFIGLTLGNIGFPVAAEILVPVAGGLVATKHLDNLGFVFAAALGGELFGGTLGYAIGRFGGRAVAERYGKYVGFHHERLDAVHAFFTQWGTFAVFLCRFIPVVRGLSPFVAGIAEMDLGPFYLWTLLGSAIFCGGLLALGDALGSRLDTALPMLHRWAYAILAAAIVVAVALVLVARARGRRSLPPTA
ncbi:MAG TPA: DedA family protein [Candidatus Tyrphobacter sp.]